MNATNWSYGLITPDGLLTDSFDAVVKCTEGGGLRVVAGRLLQLDMSRMHRMYHHTENPPPLTGDEELPPTVMGQLYRQAPGLIIIVTGRDAPQRLLRVKGNKRPALASPDTVRRAGEHLIFNSLHCPDDSSSATTELRYLVGEHEAQHLMALANTQRSDIDHLIGLRAIRRSLPSFAGWDVLSFPMIANRIRRRIVQQLTITGHNDSVCIECLADAQRGLDEEWSQLVETPLAIDRLRIAARYGPKIHAALIAAEELLGGELANGLKAIAALVQERASRELTIIYEMSERSIYLSPLERLAIEAHRHALRADEDPAMNPPRGLPSWLGKSMAG